MNLLHLLKKNDLADENYFLMNINDKYDCNLLN